MNPEILEAYNDLALAEAWLRSVGGVIEVENRNEALATLAAALDKYVEERVREIVNELVPQIIDARERAQCDSERLG